LVLQVQAAQREQTLVLLVEPQHLMVCLLVVEQVD
jgi:hypothetical protein